MRAFIYTGGAVFPDNITEHPKGDDLCIAADSGFHNAKKCGDRVDILVGDLDSIGSYKLDKKTELLQVPAEKDVTDTQLAVETAIERGANELVIIGPVVDHACYLDYDDSTAAERISRLLAEVEYWRKENDRKAKIIDKYLDS